MERTPVSSSSIASVGHDPGTDTLHVEFANSGKVYAYQGVDAETHEKLMGAQSIGAHFGKHIRPHYEGRAIS
jgi:hypothetical protein